MGMVAGFILDAVGSTLEVREQHIVHSNSSLFIHHATSRSRALYVLALAFRRAFDFVDGEEKKLDGVAVDEVRCHCLSVHYRPI